MWWCCRKLREEKKVQEEKDDMTKCRDLSLVANKKGLVGSVKC